MAAALTGFTAPAFAQDEQPEGEATEEMVVTGSRIARSALTSPGNIQVIDGEQLRQTGAATVDDLLRLLPSVTFQGTTRNDNNAGAGFRSIDLRNLSTVRTLVLVNGRRYVQTPIVVDLNDIPATLVDRIEILFDGASAVYGSDAVAGVINFILQDEFEGFKTTAQIGITDEGDGEELLADIVFGAASARGNVVMNMNFTGNEEIRQADRDWGVEAIDLGLVFNNGADASDGVTANFGSSGIPEARTFDTPGVGAAFGSVFFRPDPLTGRSYQPGPFNDLGGGPPGTGFRFNFGPTQFLIGSQERFGIHALGKYDLVDLPGVFDAEAYAEANFVHYTNTTQLAPQPLFNGFTGILPITAPITNPNIPEDFRATLAPGTTEVTIGGRRQLENGPRVTEAENFSFRQLVGFRGSFLEKGNYDMYAQYLRNRNFQSVFNSVDLDEFGDVSGQADFFGANNISAEDTAAFNYTDVQRIENEQINFLINVGYQFFALPTAKDDIGLVVGYEYRDINGETRPSSINERGDASLNQLNTIAGSFDANEVFAELNVPILQRQPFMYDMFVNGAVRYSDFSQSGDEVTFRVQGRVEPFQGIALRGSYSTAFRAPTIFELFSPAVQSFISVNDPCAGLGLVGGPSEGSVVGQNCLADGVPVGFQQVNSQIPGDIGGNPDLEAETADVGTAGITLDSSRYLPPILGRFSFTFDYYAYEVDNAIGAPPPQAVLDGCFEGSTPGTLDNAFCNLIGRDATGAINVFNLTQSNLGQIFTNGFDFSAQYVYTFAEAGLPQLGTLAFDFTGNYLQEFELVPFPGATEADIQQLEGQAVPPGATPSGLFPRVSYRLATIYSWNQLSMAWFVTYINDMTNESQAGTAAEEVGDVTYTDVSLSWTEDAWQLTFGVNNLTDESPPFVVNGSASLSDGYDFRGRFFFLRGEYRF
ncbi:MAG: TonB-dependent receptor domain-containing protein [Myxococcota bacterium]